MSTVPLIIAAIPVPEPPPLTATAQSGWIFLYSSAQVCATLTRVSEPLFWMTVRLPPLTEPPQEVSVAANKRVKSVLSFIADSSVGTEFFGARREPSPEGVERPMPEHEGSPLW